jgi:hypothetical protein
MSFKSGITNRNSEELCRPRIGLWYRRKLLTTSTDKSGCGEKPN